MHTVYVLTLQDGWFYVGQTQNIKKRLQQHKQKRFGHNPAPWFLYVIAHGGPKQAAIVGEVDTFEEACALEQQTVANLKIRGYKATCTAYKDFS